MHIRHLALATALMTITLVGVARAADLPATVVDPYIRVQESLAADKTDGVSAAAKAIESASATLGTSAAAIGAAARKLAAATTLEGARTAFGELSVALVAFAEKSGGALGPGLNLAYCPMADKPWIQKGTAIENPYYGSEMLTCGVIRK